MHGTEALIRCRIVTVLKKIGASPALVITLPGMRPEVPAWPSAPAPATLQCPQPFNDQLYLS